jgi:DNA polymerase-3 subunit gamma/tau
MLSSSAFNAFLKTLEEPPAHAIFILATTEKHKIIPTILSRCQIFDFNRIRIEDSVARLQFVSKKEGIEASEEALHVIAQKADGAMRDALSIFDQIASLSGKTITYKDVIENLNVLDFEYYFRTVDAALLCDLSSVLLTFNEILEKGFDGHNFISGLNSHLRDLLVSKDEATLKLLEATPAIRQRYLQQTARCPVSFLLRALETGNNCDLSYKNSKNPRLNVELALIKLCGLLNEKVEEPEKKKSEQLTHPEKRQIIDESLINADPQKAVKSQMAESENQHVEEHTRPENQPAGNPGDKQASRPEDQQTTSRPEDLHKHDPIIEKPSKSFSIKDLLSTERPLKSHAEVPAKKAAETSASGQKTEFTPESFYPAWDEFVSQLSGEGTRIVSMFKSIKPEFENEGIIRIHLKNAAQKDIFILNYKPRLIGFLESRFISPGIDIETTVDLSDDNEVLYTDEQKSTYLFNKYPALKEMKKTFNLDLP